MSAAAAPAEGGHGHDADPVLKGMKWLNESSGKFVDGAIGGPMRATARMVGATLGQIGDEKDYLVKNVLGLHPDPNNGLIENTFDAVNWVGRTLGGGEVAKLDAHHHPVLDEHKNPVTEYKPGWLEYLGAVPTMVTTGALGALGEKLDHVPVARVTIAPVLNAANWVGLKIGGGFGPKLDGHGHPVMEEEKDSHGHTVMVPKMEHGHPVLDASGAPVKVPKMVVVKEFKRGAAQRLINTVTFPFRILHGFGNGLAKAVGSIPGVKDLSKKVGVIGSKSVYNFKEGKYGVSEEHH